MKIVCQKGFYKFYPDKIADIRRFYEKFEILLMPKNDFFTFQALANLPNFSIKGQIYTGVLPALITTAGTPEEVMADNNYTYNQSIKGLSLNLNPSLNLKKMNYDFSNYFIMDNLPQAYFYDNNGIITGFYGFINLDYEKYYIERFIYL